MPYTYINFAQARTNLAARLSDPNKTFWTDFELKVWIIEALRTWGALTGYWRDRATFPTSANTAFYDLPTQVPALRSYNASCADLVTNLEFHLLEPPTNTLWTGSEQFTLADLTNAIQRRRDQFLVETGSVVTASTFNMPAPPSGRVALSDSTIDVRRFRWLDSTGRGYQLWRTDEWELNSLSPGWPQAMNTPANYSVAVTPPLSVQIAPPPQESGSGAMLSVNAGAAVSVFSGNLGIPDDFSPAVKWGALADLMGEDGPARDPLRAQYAEQRYQELVEAARFSGSVVNAAINEVPVIVDSLANVDGFRPNWENTQKAPDTIAMAGLNLVAFSFVPDGIYSATVDVVRNAIIPTIVGSDGTFLQVGREELDVILDYAQHLASFKQGGAEFQATFPLYQRFMRLATVRNDRLKASARYFRPMGMLAHSEEAERPRRKESAVAGV